MSAILEIKDLALDFGGVVALDGVDLYVNKGEILGVIGPNGAGKTTLYNLITGFLTPTRGRVIYKGEDVTGLPPHKIAMKGLVRTFQLAGLFMPFTARANTLIGCYMRSGLGSLGSVIPTPGNLKKQRAAEAQAMEALKLVGLGGQEGKLTQNLSYGYQKSCTIATVMGTEPELMILDEPVTALSPERVGFIIDLVRKIRDTGVTIMVTEHNMQAIFPICDRIAVLNAGKKIAEGTAREIQENPEVITAYLGGQTVV